MGDRARGDRTLLTQHVSVTLGGPLNKTIRRAVAAFALVTFAPVLLRAQRENPFAVKSTLTLQAPPFDRITNTDFQPAIEEGMRQHLAEVEAIAARVDEPTFDNTIVALEKSGEMLNRVQSVFIALGKANTSDTIQRVRAMMAPRLAAHIDAVNLDPKLFERIKSVYDRRDALGLKGEKRALVERYYRNFVRAGAQLAEADKGRLRAINQETSKLSNDFASKVLSGTAANPLILDSREELAGLSDGEIAAAADAASMRKLNGKYLIPLQNTTQQPAQSSLTNRTVRERLFNLAVHRNERGDSNDTRAIVQRLEELRRERAALLGFPT